MIKLFWLTASLSCANLVRLSAHYSAMEGGVNCAPAGYKARAGWTNAMDLGVAPGPWIVRSGGGAFRMKARWESVCG